MVGLPIIYTVYVLGYSFFVYILIVFEFDVPFKLTYVIFLFNYISLELNVLYSISSVSSSLDFIVMFISFS